MRRFLLAALIIPTACSGDRKAGDTGPDDLEELGDLEPGRAVEEGRFATSLICADCHSNSSDASAMRDERDNWIAPFDLWSSSMMANAARDPLWRAAVSAEVAATPSRAAESRRNA